MKKLQELFMNEHGELSTTNTIQLVSVSTLSLGFLVALFWDKAIANDLAYTIQTMSKEIAENNIQYKELPIRFDGFEKVQVRIDSDYKEIALRVKALELKQERTDEIIKRHDAVLTKK